MGLGFLLALSITFQSALAQDPLPPASKKAAAKANPNGSPNGPLVSLLLTKQTTLNLAVAALKGNASPENYHDIAVYARALKMGLDLKEFEVKGGPLRLAKVADLGLARVQRKTSGPWVGRELFENRGYLSRVDRSIQPYSVRFPKEYDQTKTPWPVEVVLHGRNDGLTEALFLVQHEASKPVHEKAVILEVFGRGNNAYRFAGETDVFEAFEDLFRRENAEGAIKLDINRVLLRGFSMGGAGTWHLGLHHSDRFYALQPGAGFTKTIGYSKLIPETIPAWQRRILGHYDAFEVARNVGMVPVVAYSGGDDPQKDAALTIEKALSLPGMPKDHFQHIIAPGLGHQMPPEWKRQVDSALLPFLQTGRRQNPDSIDWTALNTRHGKFGWLSITGLLQTGKPGRVVANRKAGQLVVETFGVTHLSLGKDAFFECDRLMIDGKALPLPGLDSHAFVKSPTGWTIDANIKSPRKRPGLQGPIDDAFMNPFIVTLGRGTPINAQSQKHAEALLEQFRTEWVKYMRGDFPFVEEDQITPETMRSAHVVVFGDEGSSSILAKVQKQLPYSWQNDSIIWGRKIRIPKGPFLPSMVLPNPLAPSKYLVINSGHTFHEKDFQGTNALLFSKLGDFGLWQHNEEAQMWEVLDSGTFNEQWAFDP